MMRCAIVLLGLLIAAPGAAQESSSLTVPTIIFAGASAADWATTYRNLSPYGHESNPLLLVFHDRPAPTVLAGAALDGVGAWAWDRYVGRRHPKLAAVGLYAASGFRVFIAARNASRLRNFAPTAVAVCPPGVFCRH